MSFATAQGDTAAPRNLIRWRQLHLHSQLFNIQAQDIEALPCNAYKCKYKYDYVTYKQHRSGIDEILDLEKNSRGNGPFFSISSWRNECSFLEMLSIVKILKKRFSFSSRNSRFLRKFLFLFSIEWDFANRFSSQESKFSSMWRR